MFLKISSLNNCKNSYEKYKTFMKTLEEKQKFQINSYNKLVRGQCQ